MIMKAMLLAAGKGRRMHPLTDALPKPLLQVAGKPLLQYHIEALVAAGIRDIVINHARYGEMIEAHFGTGERFGVTIRYSPEGDEPLETGGGIKQALPYLGSAPFLAINADIWTDYPFARLLCAAITPPHLVLVPNPEQHPAGDFALQDGRVQNQGLERYTFSGIGLYSPEMFSAVRQRAFPLAPLLRQQITAGQVSGELYHGQWHDIGTPERLADLACLIS